MTSQLKVSKTLNVCLWIAQVILSASLIWAAAMKLFLPATKLAAMWPWTAEYTAFVKLTGVLDLLAGIGLILPALLRIQPRLTTYAAWGIIALMIAAGVFHISRGEVAQISVNIFFAVVSAFVVWARRKYYSL